MEDSKRTRRRVTMFILSKGGRISSGQNDNLIGWLYHQLHSKSEYKHDRVSELKSTVQTMAEEGLLTLEWSEKGRLMALGVPDNAKVDVDDDDEEFFDSVHAVWLLASMLAGRVAQLEARLLANDRALDDLAAESVGTPIVPTEYLERIAELESELLAAREQHAGELLDLRRTQEAQVETATRFCREQLERVRADFTAYRDGAQRRYSRDGTTIRTLSSRIDALSSVAQMFKELPPQLIDDVLSNRARVVIVKN